MITQERLKEPLHYNPDTGIFTWIKPNKRRPDLIGKPAGWDNMAGYLKITIDYKQYFAHRLAWMYINGEWPKDQIDHINHNRSDNRIDNIRSVSENINHKNKSMPITNKTGAVGIDLHKPNGKWRAGIRVDGRHISLGHFKTKSEAAKARRDADKKYGFHANHGKG